MRDMVRRENSPLMASNASAIETSGIKKASSPTKEGRGDWAVAVTFVAVLELCKESALHLEQREPFGTLWVRPVEAEPHTEPLAAGS